DEICCRSKNTSKIGILRSFSMKFFFSSKQECMPNTIQSVFLSVTHVFVSILKLFFKIWLSKMYPYFKLLIFGYKSIFDEIFDPLRVFLGAEYESAFIFLS